LRGFQSRGIAEYFLNSFYLNILMNYILHQCCNVYKRREYANVGALQAYFVKNSSLGENLSADVPLALGVGPDSLTQKNPRGPVRSPGDILLD